MNVSLTLFAQLLAFGIPLLVLGLVVGLVIHLRGRARPEARLATLKRLHASGALTDGEYERQRASIISGV